MFKFSEKVSCIYCGKKVEKGLKYCNKCGRDISSMWKDDSEVEAKERLPMFCPNPKCHAPYVEGSADCRQCRNDFRKHPVQDKVVMEYMQILEYMMIRASKEKTRMLLIFLLSIDDKCNVVEEWVSTDKPHYIEAQLIAGKTYTLTETAAPDGYKIANSIDFTVNADGTVTPVVMYDEPIPDTPDIPTGDTTSRLPGILMIAVGLVMLLITGMSRKKKDDADEYAALCPDFIETEED